ncbi:MAG: DUF4339 domain-containing protein [Pigmentiphaga sp.]
MEAFYMARDGVQYGPFTEAKIRQLIAQQRLVGTDLVWYPGLEAWQPAAEILAAWLPPAIPKPPPLPPSRPAGLPQPASTRPFAKLGLGNPSHQSASATESAANVPAKPWAKRFESIKAAVSEAQAPNLHGVSAALGYPLMSEDRGNDGFDHADPEVEDDGDGGDDSGGFFGWGDDR